MRLFSISAVLLVGFIGTGFFPATARADNKKDQKVQLGDLRQGERLYGLHCQSCHGLAGNGQGRIKTTPVAPALDDPASMTLLSDQQVFAFIDKGGAGRHQAATMPAFGESLDDLEIWDLVAYLRSRHLGLTDFYPAAESFYGERYVIDQWGLERHQALTRVSVASKDNRFTVLGVYKGVQGPAGPRLIPNTPLALSEVKRSNKVGYVVFVSGKLPGIKGKQLFGISMDSNGLIWKVQVNSPKGATGAKLAKLVEPFLGYGQKGMKEPLEGNRGRQGRAVAKAFTEIYSRAMEAVVMYDKAERERHWADSDFGGPADPEASVEGGELKVGNGKKHRKARKHR